MDDAAFEQLMAEQEIRDRERCVCGHEVEHHVAGGYRQNSYTGKSYWKRHCRGHKGYSTLTGEKPCRCSGYQRQG